MGWLFYFSLFCIQESHAPILTVLEGSAVHKHVSTLLSRGDKTHFFRPVQPSGRERAVESKKVDPDKKKKGREKRKKKRP